MVRTRFTALCAPYTSIVWRPVPHHAIRTRLAVQPTQPRQIIDVRQHLAEREAHLMRVEQAPEQHGHDLGGRFRRTAAGLDDCRATTRVMLLELPDAGVQAAERQLMAG